MAGKKKVPMASELREKAIASAKDKIRESKEAMALIAGLNKYASDGKSSFLVESRYKEVLELHKEALELLGYAIKFYQMDGEYTVRW